MESITLSRPDHIYEPGAGPACERHDGWPLHIPAECARLAGVRPYSQDWRCSVCELPWGEGLVSEHESCATVHSSGRREYAHPRLWVDHSSLGVVEIENA